MSPVFEQIADAKFVVAWSGESPACQVIHGWQAVLAHVKEETGSDDADGLIDMLHDEDWWVDDGWKRLPFRFTADIGETATLTIFRITTED